VYAFPIFTMGCPYNFPQFGYLNNILWKVKIIKLLVIQFSPSFCYYLLNQNILLSTLFSNIFKTQDKNGVPILFQDEMTDHPSQRVKIVSPSRPEVFFSSVWWWNCV
jgi:hypothetical protein